jgi:hypothetical protein
MTLVRSVILVAVLAGPAGADDELPPLPDRAVTLSVMGHAGRIGGVTEGGLGPNVEVAFGQRRWQYFAEGNVSWVSLGQDDARISGKAVRGGAGIRWLARAFELGDRGSIDLHLEAFAGVTRFDFDAMDRIVRPDLGVGVGYQIRGRWHGGRSQAAFRISARIYFAPTDREVATAVCRGTCPTSSGVDNSGLMAVFGAQL